MLFFVITTRFHALKIIIIKCEINPAQTQTHTNVLIYNWYFTSIIKHGLSYLKFFVEIDPKHDMYLIVCNV